MIFFLLSLSLSLSVTHSRLPRTEAKLLAIHPTHAQTTPQHQIHAQQQQPQQCQQQQQLSSTNKPGNCQSLFFILSSAIFSPESSSKIK